MATVADVRRIALSLPETAERESRRNLQWRVKDRVFAWERPLRRGDIDEPGVYFTTPHFNGHPAIVFELDRITVDELTELITEAWLAQAPRKLASAFRRK
ncbi:MAG TPA: MmcQ/YjbR family DNA-binding protein [Streptosporangiaceae bacterium]|nr:MmcQ/YjbR family DNA-binding protein [Streptosporangiaceae bacterium]